MEEPDRTSTESGIPNADSPSDEGTAHDTVDLDIDFEDLAEFGWQPSHHLEPIRAKRRPVRSQRTRLWDAGPRRAAEALAAVVVLAFTASFLIIVAHGGDRMTETLTSAAEAFGRPLTIVLSFIAGAKAVEKAR